MLIDSKEVDVSNKEAAGTMMVLCEHQIILTGNV